MNTTTEKEKESGEIGFANDPTQQPLDFADQDKPDSWDRLYKTAPYQDRIPHDRELWKKFIDRCIQHPGDDKAAGDCTEKIMSVLELGCGVGDYCDHLRQRGHAVVGTDYSSEAVKEAKKRYPDTSFRVIDIRNIMQTYPMTRFDVILCFEVIEHFKDPDKILYLIMKMLRPGGRLLFSLPHKDGRSGHISGHYTYWDHNTIVEVFGRFFSMIGFDRVHAMCDKLNIFGVCRR